MEVLRTKRVAYRAYADGSGGVLLNLNTSHYFSVNPIGAAIWELIGDGGEVEDIVDGLRAKLEEPPTALADDVKAFLNELANRKLVTLE